MRRALSKKERERVYMIFNGRCAYCGRNISFEELQCDHKISLHNHGPDDVSNILPACKECNYYKRGSNPDGFRKKLRRAFKNSKNCEFVKRLLGFYGEEWDDSFLFEKNGEQLK